jgi:hypothetical protein
MSDLLRKSFSDIAVGYSHGIVLGKTCYVRHLSYHSQIGYERKREDFYNEGKRSGLLTDAERLTQIKGNGEWDEAKDKLLANSKIVLEGLITTKSRAKHPSMIAGLSRQIKEEEDKINKIDLERALLMGLTCEVYADRELNDYYIFTNLFSDTSLTAPVFSDDEFSYLSNDDMSKICDSYNTSLAGCSDKSIKKLAMMPFFQKYFSLVGEDISSFFGKPICQLTFYQVDLLRYASQFRHIFQNNDTSNWPKHVFDDPDMLMDYATTVAKGREDAQKQGAYDEGSVVLGAKPEDAKALGLKTRNSLAKDIVQSGGNVLDFFSKGGVGKSE